MRGSEADRAALEDMLSYAERVRHHVASRSSLEEELVRDAALYELAILGEGANRLSRDLREAHPEVPWARIIALRNFLLHVYHRIDLDLVWDAVHQLPRLEEQLHAILEEVPQ